MNLMHIILSDIPVINKRKYGAREKIILGKQLLEKYRLKISNEYTQLGSALYYKNCLPLIVKTRDVLKKPLEVCKIRVNWKRKICTPEEYLSLKEQWGWTVTVVDAGHTRNKYKNKSTLWVVFDSKERAQKALTTFNTLFITAMEQDAIEEYKKFKENPEKRILSFDKILPTAYELYEEVDKGNI